MMNIDNESTCSSQETPDLVPSTVMVRTTMSSGRPQEQTATEVSPQESTHIVPRELTGYDILCGRNKLAFNHVGNRRFRVTISLFLNQYFQKPGRTDRSILILHILETIHKAGGRFLKEETNSHGNDDDSMSTSSSGSNSSYWVELSEKEQRNKIGHALRDAAAAYHLAEKKKKAKQMVAAKRRQRLAAAAASSQAIPTVIHSSSLVQAHDYHTNVNVAVQYQKQQQYQRPLLQQAPRRRSSSLRSSFQMLSNLFPIQ